MAGRSLCACEAGQKKAELALTRKQLTQTALVKERGIASWTTVSKFFNGGPVDRIIFQEICHVLDLDWEEIAGVSEEWEPEPEPEELTGELLEAVWRCGARSRLALDPYILTTIRREGVLEKCLQQIRLGLGGKQRVVPILGAAGYGKSTILGMIYDELRQQTALEGWIALVRCDDLVQSADKWAEELGAKASDRPLTMIEIAQQLTAQRGRGVLLIDTLDIVLTKPLVPVFRQMVLQLLECGTTVAFTCRDNDYAEFFEPYHESFAGFRESVADGCKVTQFTPEEVRLAAQAFASLQPEYPTEASQIAFAEKILALSADRVSLAEIAANPLLLALLCELFAAAQIVPEDLTVSQLYQIYWDWKIAKSRHHQQSRRIGKAKEKLCLFIAETLYHNSGDKLRDFIYETSLYLATDTDFDACSALLSDGVLKELGSDRIGFFHQTFLEYTVARWLNATPSGEQIQIQILSHLQTGNTAVIPYYIWPIWRQFLTLVTADKFNYIYNHINLSEILPFRSLAFAAVSRPEPESAEILSPLFAIAKDREYTYNEALLIAANSAPKRHEPAVWAMMVQFLATVGKELVNKAIDIAANLVAQSEEAGKFTAAVKALNDNPLIQADVNSRHHLWGKFLSEYYGIIRSQGRAIDPEILAILQQQYADFGSKARAIVIDLYLTPGIPQAVQRDFLLTIIHINPANNSFTEKANAITLVSKLLPDLLASGESPWGDSYLSLLAAPLQPEWLGVMAAAVGERAATDPILTENIVSKLFDPKASEISKSFNRSIILALQAAIQSGGADMVAQTLLKRQIETIGANHISTLAMIVRTLAGEGLETSPITADLAIKLAAWVQPIVARYPVELIRVMDALAVKSTPVQTMLGDLLETLLDELEPKTAHQICKKLACIPPQLVPYLQRHSQIKEARIALLKLYQQQASANPEIIPEIIKFCRDVSQDVAKDASWLVLGFAQEQKPIPLASLLPILSNSPVIGVRQNCLQAIIERVNAQAVTPAEIAQVLAAISQETAPEVLQLAYKLTTAAIWNHPGGEKTLEWEIATAIFGLTRSVVGTAPGMTLDSIANGAITAFNQIGLLEDTRLIPELTECSRQLLRSVDIRGKIDKLVVTGLLNTLAKFDPQLLAKMVEEDLETNGQILPIANQQALVVAISHNQGYSSPLLDLMLAHPRVSEETKSRILQQRHL